MVFFCCCRSNLLWALALSPPVKPARPFGDAIVCIVPNSRNVEPVSTIANRVSAKKIGYGKFRSGD
jgi:hypothetical protein